MNLHSYILTLVIIIYLSITIAQDNSLVICRAKTKKLRCNDDKALKITSATFGRNNQKTCKPRRVYKRKCMANVTKNVKQLCTGFPNCTLTVSKDIVGSSCSKIEGYLHVKFSCIDKDIDSCRNNPCKNNGTCQNTDVGVSCVCQPGFTGKFCEKDIDGCRNNPCKNNGKCIDGNSNYTCACQPGFTGNQCQTDIDECSTKPCKNKGICKDRVNGFTCICVAYFTGKLCEIAPMGCISTPCKNGGSCKEGTDGYKCICVPGYGGVNCQTDIDDCLSKPCHNGGVCKDLVNGYKCICKPDFIGDNCEKEAPIECGTPYWNPTFVAWRIVGGIAARNYSWPWIVQLRLKDTHQCGGAIIAPQWVATARHCFLSNGNPTDWTILAGRTHKTAAEPLTEQIRNVSKIIACPNPTLSYLNKDICLIKVDTDFLYNKYVRPICLPTRLLKKTDRCYVKGWGSTFGTGYDKVLKQTHLPVKNATECNTTMNAVMTGLIITNDMFCAGYDSGGHDACQGDSGGPFDCQYDDGKWYLSGIVSWGIGCAQKNMPGVYANVFNFVKWIQDTMQSN